MTSPSSEDQRGRRFRLLLGAGGVGVMVFAAVQLLLQAKVTEPVSTGIWLVGAVLLHDLLIGPLVCVVGTLLAVMLPRPTRTVVQAGFASAGALTLVALPPLLAPDPSYSSLRPRDYGEGLLLALLCVALVTCVVAAAVEVRRRAAGSGRTPPRS